MQACDCMFALDSLGLRFYAVVCLMVLFTLQRLRLNCLGLQAFVGFRILWVLDLLFTSGVVALGC